MKNCYMVLCFHRGNDAANVLAIATCGNINDFVILMNDTAKKIGCKDTHFVNTHGYYDENHYTTAYDMAIILNYALKNETFKKIIETHTYTLPKTNMTDEERVLTSTNKLFNKNYPSVYYEYALGGKTGYTIESRGTFVGYAKKDDKTIIVAAFNGSQNVNGNEARFLDSKALWNYTFDNYTKKLIIKNSTINFEFIDKKTNTKYKFNSKDDLYSLIKNDENNITKKVTYNIPIDFSTINNISSADSDKSQNMDINIKGNDLNAKYNTKLTLNNESKYYNLLSKRYIHYYIYAIIALLSIILLICIIRLILVNKRNKSNIFIYSRRRK